VFVAGFIGSPAMNLLQLPIVDGGVKWGSLVIPIEKSILAKTKAKSVTVGVRPEDLQVTKGDGIPIEIDVVEELGADGYLYGHTKLDGADHDLVARVESNSHPNAGVKVNLKPVGGITHLFDVETGLRLN
jgi:multiple sugar transport system ATP-binding protein